MDPTTIGQIAGGLVVVSIIPYAMRVYQGKITTNLTTWLLWSVLGLALLLTYRSSGAEESVWPAVFGFTNPLLIFILTLRAKRRAVVAGPQVGIWAGLAKTDKACLIFGLTALTMWFFMRDSKSLSQYALCVAILADACAGIPTVAFLWNNPREDRPFAWGMFSIGYGLAIFAVTDPTPSNYILPAYM